MNSIVKTNSRAFVACSAALLLAGVFGTCNASGSDQVYSETVKFQDLNVSNPAGAKALYERIHAAAVRNCIEVGEWKQIRELRCVSDATARAIAKVNLPALNAYYQAKNGNHAAPLTASR